MRGSESSERAPDMPRLVAEGSDCMGSDGRFFWWTCCSIKRPCGRADRMRLAISDSERACATCASKRYRRHASAGSDFSSARNLWAGKRRIWHTESATAIHGALNGAAAVPALARKLPTERREPGPNLARRYLTGCAPGESSGKMSESITWPLSTMNRLLSPRAIV